LNVHWFETLAEARRPIDAWRIEYNESRPHMALGNIPLSEYALAATVLRYHLTWIA
jgi:putative transposase